MTRVIHSSALEIPRHKFTSIPCSNLANVDENIDNWISRKDINNINTFLRLDLSKSSGYRFVDSSDLDQIVAIEQTIKKCLVMVIFTRRVCTPNHFFPLCFREEDLYANICIDNVEPFEYQSDAHLYRMIKLSKEGLKV